MGLLLLYGTRVTLADGSQEKIGRIVNQRLPVEVLTYNFDTGQIEPRRVVNWFDNGRTDEFMRFTVAKPGGNGRAPFSATWNHLIRTPGVGGRRPSCRSAIACCRPPPSSCRSSRWR